MRALEAKLEAGKRLQAMMEALQRRAVEAKLEADEWLQETLQAASRPGGEGSWQQGRTGRLACKDAVWQGSLRNPQVHIKSVAQRGRGVCQGTEAQKRKRKKGGVGWLKAEPIRYK